MKKITAYIKPIKLSEVTLALHKVKGLTGMSVAEVRGFGRGWGHSDDGSSQESPGDFKPIVKLEVFCREDILDEIVTTIERRAHTGLRGDGKIYVIPVEQAVRISAGERGEKAI